MPFLELCVLPGRREVPEVFGGSGRSFFCGRCKILDVFSYAWQAQYFVHLAKTGVGRDER